MKENLTAQVYELAVDLLDNQPEPVLFYLPVWSEIDKIIVDFELAYSNKEAKSLLGSVAGQLLSEQWNTTDERKSWQAHWFSQLKNVYLSGKRISEHYANATTEQQFDLICSRAQGGVLAVVHEMPKSSLAPDRQSGMSLTSLSKKAQGQESLPYDSRIQTIFDTTHAGMYTLTPVRDEHGEIFDFRFGLVNQAVASYLGLQSEELAGTLGSVFFPAYKSNGLFDRYVETMKTGKPATFDLHYADGYDNFFTINIVKIGDELFGTFTDHSDLKRLQRQLENSISELRRSNTSLEQFAHAASHDLQEPLRKIAYYTARLEEQHGEELTDEAFGCVERIKTASKRMRRLIKDLLVFAEVGASRPAFEEVALNPLLQEVLNDLEVSISERDAVIEIGELGKIKGDALHLQQLFQNLISNSLKYSRIGVPPRITISATKLAGKDAGVDLGAYESEQDYLQIRLQDNGQGFSNEQAKQIFKIFQRLPQHRTEYSGTGIGLAIVQRVVENHKGYIKAEGVPGKGATFTILLPLNTAA